MKKENIFQTMLVILVVCISLVIPAQGFSGCLTPDNYNPPSVPATRTPPTDDPRTIKHIESDISDAEYEIWRLNRVAAEKRFHADHPGHNADHWRNKQYQEAAALEKQAEQLKKKLSRLEQERQTMISQTGGCFLPNTLVSMADGSVKPFEQIRPGDQVLTYDIGYQTVVSKPVIDVYSVEGNHLYTINGELATTGSERLLSGTGWKRVRDLKEGNEVQIDGSMVKIVSIDYHREDHKLYNMQVDDSHNFYIVTGSGARYLVHNSCGGGSK